jgi:hypothetical protein
MLNNPFNTGICDYPVAERYRITSMRVDPLSERFKESFIGRFTVSNARNASQSLVSRSFS